jgi:hypothetical protein
MTDTISIVPQKGDQGFLSRTWDKTMRFGSVMADIGQSAIKNPLMTLACFSTGAVAGTLPALTDSTMNLQSNLTGHGPKSNLFGQTDAAMFNFASALTGVRKGEDGLIYDNKGNVDIDGSKACIGGQIGGVIAGTVATTAVIGTFSAAAQAMSTTLQVAVNLETTKGLVKTAASMAAPPTIDVQTAAAPAPAPR